MALPRGFLRHQWSITQVLFPCYNSDSNGSEKWNDAKVGNYVRKFIIEEKPVMGCRGMYKAAPFTIKNILFSWKENSFHASTQHGEQMANKWNQRLRLWENLLSINVSYCHVNNILYLWVVVNIPMRSPGKNPAKSKHKIYWRQWKH